MGKIAMITAGTASTGLEIATKFAAEGYDLILTGRNENNYSLAKERLKSINPNVKVHIRQAKC